MAVATESGVTIGVNKGGTGGGFTLPTLTSGSALFSNGTTIAQDNANFFWDDTNNRLGLGTSTPRGGVDVNKSVTIGAPTINAQPSFNYGSGANYFNDGYAYQFQIYAYKVVGAVTIYSATPLTTTVATDNGLANDSYTVSCSWNAVSGADGYRIVAYDEWYGANFDYYFDTTDTNFELDGGSDLVGSGSYNQPVVITPTSAGASFWVNDTTGELSNSGAVTATGTATFANAKNVLAEAKATFPAGSVIAGAGAAGPGIGFTDYPLDGFASRGDNLGFWQAGTLSLNVTDTLKEYRIPSNYYYGWASSTNNNSATDTSLRRGAANTIYVGSSASGNLNATKIFAGGTTVPTAKMHLGAGTASANTAPLKFTTGTLLTSQEGGAVEYSTPDFYITAGAGVRAKLAHVHSTASISLTAQSAAIGSTLIMSATVGGLYRISYVATVTRAATTSSILGGTNGFQVSYTDTDDSVVKTSQAGVTSAANTTATSISGTVTIWAKAATNINYTFGYTSVGATTMQYNLHASIERVL